MENFLKYKDYIGSVEFSADDNILFGNIIGINDLVNYEGKSVDKLKEAFIEAVDDYLITCEELGKEPNKFYKGVFNVRTSNQRHRDLVIIAGKRKIKLNELVNVTFDYLVQNEDKVLETLK